MVGSPSVYEFLFNIAPFYDTIHVRAPSDPHAPSPLLTTGIHPSPPLPALIVDLNLRD